MAYDLQGTNWYVYTDGIGSFIGATAPCTLSCWAYRDTIFGAGDQVVLNLGAVASGAGVRLLIQHDGTPVAQADNNVGNNLARSPCSGWSGWGHFLGVFTSTTSRTGYVNGAAGTTNTNTSDTYTPGRVVAGGIVATSGNSKWFDGKVAEIGIWNVALTADEIGMLAAGVSPLVIRPGSLKMYWSARGQLAAPWPGLTLTAVNAVVFADHPPKCVYRRSIQTPSRALLLPGKVAQLSNLWTGARK